MAKIDLAALKAASEGDQSKKVTVSKKWLRVVHDELRRMYAAESDRGSINGLADRLFGKF